LYFKSRVPARKEVLNQDKYSHIVLIYFSLDLIEFVLMQAKVIFASIQIQSNQD